VFFPADGERPSEEPREPVVSEGLGGAETLLVVEDDEQLRALVMSQLRSYGYRTIACRGGAEALELAGSEPIDLLLTDVVMPGIGGRALAEAFVQRSPGTRVLFMSGHPNDAIVRHGVSEATVAFLQKPFRPDVLARRVREVLQGR
jgi:DNA-binding NtrC family response regulator